MLTSCFNWLLTEFGRCGTSWSGTRVSSPKGYSVIPLSEDNRYWAFSSCERMYSSWDLPHGLLPDGNCLRGGDYSFKLCNDKEGSCWEVEGQWKKHAKGRFRFIFLACGTLIPMIKHFNSHFIISQPLNLTWYESYTWKHFFCLVYSISIPSFWRCSISTCCN